MCEYVLSVCLCMCKGIPVSVSVCACLCLCESLLVFVCVNAHGRRSHQIPCGWSNRHCGLSHVGAGI